VEREVLISSPTETQDVWECFEAASGEVLTGHWEAFLYHPERWSMPHACQCPRKRHLDNALRCILQLLVSPGVLRQSD